MRVRDMMDYILDKRVFTIEEMTEHFYSLWKGILPRYIIKKRITEFLIKQFETGFVKKLYTNGHNYTIFGIKDATRQELENYLPTCEICGKKFYPIQHGQRICGKACKREYVRRFKRRKKGYKDEERYYANWTEEEDRALLEAFRDFHFNLRTAEELARKLKRSPFALKKRLYKLKKKLTGGNHAN